MTDAVSGSSSLPIPPVFRHQFSPCMHIHMPHLFLDAHALLGPSLSATHMAISFDGVWQTLWQKSEKEAERCRGTQMN
ncbi:hypothetical protein M5D96_011947 [Drosophila gunungcola]|uniref:Uncharacterized protein n=1 Tax=Drosophila gunungcola TaxID=103775 RepID=A0A9P9YE07_9MUSC|nr:hypothetical protein M5D96_011947 [Drosophila gunungcola]